MNLSVLLHTCIVQLGFFAEVQNDVKSLCYYEVKEVSCDSIAYRLVVLTWPAFLAIREDSVYDWRLEACRDGVGFADSIS